MTQRQPRLLDPGYLAWLRKQPCACGCGRSAPSDAAHIRYGSVHYDKPPTGMGQKPDDKWALPLNHSCHMRQHAYGDEKGWWHAHGYEPLLIVQGYWHHYRAENPGANPPYVRKLRSIKPRKPREQRAKIRGRNNLRRKNENSSRR